MTTSAEPTYEFAADAIAALRKAKLPASPKYFELWYMMYEGRSPALARDIQRATKPDGAISPEDANSLYEDHVVRQGLSRDVVDLIQRFEDEMGKVADVVVTTGASATGNSEKLRVLTNELKRSAVANPAVGALLDGVLSVAKSVREANERLESQLERSSNEVVTLRRNIENIQQEATLDPLTGVKNRKSFDQELARLINDASQSGAPLALVMADVDHFKKFNDKWGHQTGDHVLRLVADVMNANVKGQDVLARYGGEEFAIILPGTSIANAVMLADRMRCAVESRRLKKRRTEEDLGVITLSMGAALFKWGDTAETLIERADACLYAAKKTGRNRVFDENALAAQGASSAA